MTISPSTIRPAALMLFCAGALLFGCKSSTQPATDTAKKYLSRTSPERVISDFEAAFERRSVAYTDSILDAGFVFRFQQSDINSGAPDSLTRPEILNTLEHLFVTGVAGDNPPAGSIRLNTSNIAISDDNRIGHEGWKVYVISTALRINFANGNVLTVDAPAQLFLRQVPSGSGQWRIAAWRDIAGYAVTGRRRATPQGTSEEKNLTWGRLLNLYR